MVVACNRLCPGSFTVGRPQTTVEQVLDQHTSKCRFLKDQREKGMTLQMTGGNLKQTYMTQLLCKIIGTMLRHVNSTLRKQSKQGKPLRPYCTLKCTAWTVLVCTEFWPESCLMQFNSCLAVFALSASLN